MLNIIHKQFSKLYVLKEVEKRGYFRYFLCECACGGKIITRMSSLTTRRTKSCGCIQKECARKLGKDKKTHGMSKTRFYNIWKGIFVRCFQRKRKSYKDYGGRGITICDRWRKFENFRDDMLLNYTDNLTIDRIDNNGNYCKENCRWATIQEQNRNKRMFKLTKEKVKEIRNRYEFGNGKVLAKEYGVCCAVISEIVNKKRNYANY